MTLPTRKRLEERASSEEGYLLLGFVVVCFLILLALGVAAPRVAKRLERDREVESEHRAQEYVRAIELYYRRTHRFPTSVEELLGTGTSGVSTALKVKYLRQQFKDPLTGGDYRLILVGKAKTEVKGFFGEPLESMPVGNLGSIAGMQSSPGAPAGAFGGTAAVTAAGSSGLSFGSTSSFGGTQSSSVGTQTAATGATAISATSATTGLTTGTAGSSTDATTFQGSKGAFLGVASNAKGHGSVEWNGSENIEDWEFLYDPRVEVLKAKVSIFGGSPAASGSGPLGSRPGAASTSIFGPGTGAGAAGVSTPSSGAGAPGTGTAGAPGAGSNTSVTPNQP